MVSVERTVALFVAVVVAFPFETADVVSVERNVELSVVVVVAFSVETVVAIYVVFPVKFWFVVYL